MKQGHPVLNKATHISYFEKQTSFNKRQFESITQIQVDVKKGVVILLTYITPDIVCAKNLPKNCMFKNVRTMSISFGKL